MPKRRARGEGTIYQRPDGLWCGQITLPDGKRKTKYHKVQKVVRDWLTEQRQSIHQGGWSSQEDITLAEFIGRYMTDVVSRNVRPQTLTNYRRHIDRLVLPKLGKLKLSAIRPDHIQHLYSELSDAGLSAGTILIVHGVLRQALNQAEEWNLIGRSPVNRAKPPRQKTTPPRLLTAAELAIFLKATEGHWINTMVTLAVTTGLRRGELLALTWKDIELEAGVLHVKHGVVDVGGTAQLSDPKSRRGVRRVTLPRLAIQSLRNYQARASQDGLLFPNRSGGLMNPVVVNNVWAKKLAEIDIPHVNFHSLRHLHSTMLLESGVNPKVVQERLGHSSIAITLGIYSHVTAGLEREAAEAIDSLMPSTTA